MMALSRSKEAHENCSLCFFGYKNTDIWPQRRRRQRLALFASIVRCNFDCQERERTPTVAVFGGLKSYFYIAAAATMAWVNYSILLHPFPRKHFSFPREPEPCVWKQQSWRRGPTGWAPGLWGAWSTHPLSNPSFSWLSWSSIFTRTFLYLF